MRNIRRGVLQFYESFWQGASHNIAVETWKYDIYGNNTRSMSYFFSDTT